jgi:serine carboxypeptidase 1
MKFAIAATLQLFAILGFLHAQDTVQTPNGPLKYDEDWGYVTVRPNAHTFWWLQTVKSDTSRPLILWLQGGPGSSSTGFGNIEELGPKDINLQDRNYTWLQVADLVFVDNPVGTGFSYVDDSSAFTTNVKQIGADLVVWAKAFYKKHPEYETRNFYVFCESYGGKMSAEFGKQLQDAIDQGSIKAKLAGVALGDSWISAMDFVNTWPEYLYSVSYLDGKQLDTANAKAAECQKLVDNTQWYDATTCWGEMEDLIGQLTAGVSWYNILKAGGTDDWSKKVSLKSNKYRKTTVKERAFHRRVGHLQSDALNDLMNGKIRQKFGSTIPAKVKFGAQGGAVFDQQWGDFMTPNYDTVDNLLNRGVKVTVFNGQLDLICNTLGVELWLKRLQWQYRDNFLNSAKTSFGPSDRSEVWGFQKGYKNLQFFYILRAGHMVAHDVPWPALEVVKKIVGKSN